MKKLGKSTRIVLTVLIGIALLWVSFCMLYFSHAHIDENGHLLFHAHPFHENTGGHQLPHHTHTKIEYIFLSAFYHFVSLLLVCLFLWQWLSFPKVFRKEPEFCANISEIIRKSILKRGPPSFTSI